MSKNKYKKYKSEYEKDPRTLTEIIASYPLKYQDFDLQSKNEGLHGEKLVLWEKMGYIKEFKAQVRYHLVVLDKWVCSMIVDFEVPLPDGRIEVHEIKKCQTTKTHEWKLKVKLFKILYPHIRYRVDPMKII